MRQFLLVGLFTILLADIMLGLGLSLAPGLSLKNAAVYVIFMALVLEFVLGDRDTLPETWSLHSAWILLGLYATFSWLAITLLGLHRGYSSVGSFIFLKGQLGDLFLFLLVYLYGSKDALKSGKLLRWLVAVFVVVNIVTFIDAFNIPDLGIIREGKYGRLTGPVKEVNQYGAVLIFIIPVTAGLTLSSSGLQKVIFGIGTIVAFVLLGLTVSRGSYFGLIAGSFFALYLVRAHVNREAIIRGGVAVLLLISIVGLAIFIQNPDGFLAKFDLVGSSLDSVSSGRWYFWHQTLSMMSNWPASFIIGYGWNSYTTVLSNIGDPHNTYLNLWFNLGLIGLGLYLYIVFWIVRFSVRSLNDVSTSVKPIVIGLITGFLSLHVALFFVALFTPWLFIWALTGSILRITVEDRRERLMMKPVEVENQ